MLRVRLYVVYVCVCVHARVFVYACVFVRKGSVFLSLSLSASVSLFILRARSLSAFLSLVRVFVRAYVCASFVLSSLSLCMFMCSCMRVFASPEN